MSDAERRATLNEQIEQGGRAEVDLSAIKDVFAELRAECFDTFCRSDPHDSEGRDKLHSHMMAMNQLEDRLRLRMVKGKNAQDELVRENRNEMKVV